MTIEINYHGKVNSIQGLAPYKEDYNEVLESNKITYKYVKEFNYIHFGTKAIIYIDRGDKKAQVSIQENQLGIIKLLE